MVNYRQFFHKANPSQISLAKADIYIYIYRKKSLGPEIFNRMFGFDTEVRKLD